MVPHMGLPSGGLDGVGAHRLLRVRTVFDQQPRVPVDDGLRIGVEIALPKSLAVLLSRVAGKIDRVSGRTAPRNRLYSSAMEGISSSTTSKSRSESSRALPVA